MLFDEMNKILFKDNKEIEEFNKPIFKNGLNFFKDLCSNSKVISARYLLNLLRDIIWGKSNDFDSVKKYIDFLYMNDENNNAYNSASSNNNNSNMITTNNQSYTELLMDDIQVNSFSIYINDFY